MNDCEKVNHELKTSEGWNNIFHITILDYDGWDRGNFQFSFFEELITSEEFHKRVVRSTCKLSHQKN